MTYRYIVLYAYMTADKHHAMCERRTAPEMDYLKIKKSKKLKSKK